MATKDSKAKNVIIASDHITKEEQDLKETRRIDIGISMEKLNIGPKKKLLVLLIGGILCHKVHHKRSNTVPKNRRPDFSLGQFLIYKRPYVEGFLKFCFQRFEVGIWSSSMEHNIGGILTNVMGDLKDKLLFTWDQNQCTKTDFMCLDNKDKPVFLKELDHLWMKKYRIDLPWSDGEYSASNTLLVTDPVKTLLNPPNTAIYTPLYDPGHNRDDFLGPKGEFRAFLDGLAEAKDVQSYVKDHRIGEPAITPSHADWNYYSKIIKSLGKK